MNLALALKAREGAAGRHKDKGAVAQACKQVPRMLVLRAVVHPVVVLDVLGEVAKRCCGDGRHRAHNRLQAVVIVMAAKLNVLIVRLGLVKRAADLLANPVQRAVLQALRARVLHRHKVKGALGRRARGAVHAESQRDALWHNNRGNHECRRDKLRGIGGK